MGDLGRRLKQRCLALLNRIDATKVRSVISRILTERGRPIAQLLPDDEDHADAPTMGSVTLVAHDDEDYFSTGDTWRAERGAR